MCRYARVFIGKNNCKMGIRTKELNDFMGKWVMKTSYKKIQNGDYNYRT
jgi:hypothetical protein